MMQNIWKGGFLGGIATLLGLEIFFIIFIPRMLPGVYFTISNYLTTLRTIQGIFVIPGVFAGIFFGMILGFLANFYPKQISICKMKTLTVFFALLFHGLLVTVIYWHHIYYGGYSGKLSDVAIYYYLKEIYYALPIYILTSIWFADRFHSKDVKFPEFLISANRK